MADRGETLVKRLMSFTGVLWLCITAFGCNTGGCFGDAFQLRTAATAMAVRMGASDPRASNGTYSSVPALKFTGNATVMVPSTVNGTTFGPGMVRQANCSMTEYFAGGYNLTAGSLLSSSVPNYQNYLHSAAQLTTTANVFKNGCAQTMVGAASTSVVYAGQTKGGAIIGAGLDYNNHFYYGSVNLTTGVAAYTTVTSIAVAVSAAAVDLNGDGNQDLLVADLGGSGVAGGVWVLLGMGDGTFATPVKYLSGMQAAALVVDDFNGDKKLDVVVTTNGTSIFMPGNGDGTFGTAVTIAAAGTSYIGTIASGDVNGDGKKDLVTSQGTTYLGAGDGTFTAGPAVAAVLYGLPVLGDFNNDGKLDVAFNGVGGKGVTVSLGKGDGTFIKGPVYASIYGSSYMSALDIDGDGNLDLVVGEGNSGAVASDENTAGVYEVLMGNGDGTFQGAASYALTTTGLNLVASVSSLKLGDFNGDGLLDILSGAGSAGIAVLPGDGKGHFGTPVATPASLTGVIAAARMNADTTLDAVYFSSVNGSGAVAVAFGNGDGTFAAAKTYVLPNASASGTAVATGDLDGDGFQDVVATVSIAGSTATTSAVYVFLNDGSGGLKAGSQLDTGITENKIFVADLNGDGKLDLVVADAGSFIGLGGPAGSVKVYLGNGDGTFKAGVAYTPGADINATALADVTKDGIADLIVASSDNSGSNPYLNVLPGKGDGTFGAAIKTVEQDNHASGLTVADFDGDGNADVLQGGCCGSTFASIFLGSGNGTFSANYALANGVSIGNVAAADLNGDGHPDLILAPLEGGGAGIEVMLNLYGSAVTTAGTTTVVTASPNPATVGAKVTLTATVAAVSGYGTATTTPTGTITFLDGTTSLGTGTLTAGVATFSTTGLSAGTHSITASYGGDSANAVSVSTAISLVVNAVAVPSFTFGLSPASGSVTGTGTDVSTATITPVNGFSQVVSFACSGLPARSACSFSPATVTPNGTAAASSTLTITTTAAAANEMPARPRERERTPMVLAGVAGLALAGMRRRFGRVGYSGVGAALLGMVLLGMSGCGGKATASSGGGTSPVTTVITVTASAGTLSQTATYTLTTQ